MEEPDLGLQYHQPKSRLKNDEFDIQVWNMAFGGFLVLSMEMDVGVGSESVKAGPGL